MYLKSIEIQGFKSFANKINFQFHNGITGIVGPNGSGKSNVADAVRWVLGEQRIKQLRGASMQDVIFSGTETRKPLSYAYVAITLDNSDHQLAIDFEEVTVARRIYRSGESEYLINGAPCRLKDVNELFYDTGIGKEGYSIIGQGQIDKILSGKPEERRELFDEAAGIVKFKRRKAAAQHKLENEKQNLIRVNDILTELEKQIGPLEKQSEVAKVYLKKKEELKTLDVNVFLLEHNRIKEQLAQVEEKYNIATNQLQDSTVQYDEIKQEYERIQLEIQELEQSIEETRNNLADSGMMRSKLENQIDVLKEQIHSAGDSAEHLNKRKVTLKADISAKDEEKQGILAEKADIDTQVQELTETVNALREDLLQVQGRIEELNNTIEDGKNTIIEELNRRGSIRARVVQFDTMLEQTNIRKAELNQKLLRAKSDEAEREENIRQLEEVFRKVSDELREMNETQAATELELGDIREKLIGKDAKLREVQGLLGQEKSKLDVLTNITERYDGYGGSVKKVMEQKDRNPGIIGVVADIIKVEKQYETAIETALGGNIQNIVTDDEDTAKKMIGYLKQNKLGRATFLPLTSITNPQLLKDDAVLEEKGVIGVADELVSIDKKYANVAKAMLGRIVVVDQVDHAVKIARKYDYSIRMVTLEGELLVPGGAISGGAFKNNSNLLGRRREIEELEKKVQKLQAQEQAIDAEIQKIRDGRNQKRTFLEKLKMDIHMKTIEQNTARINISQVRERMQEEVEGVQSLKQEGMEIESKLFEIKNGQEGIQRELAESEQHEKQLQEQIVALQKQMEEQRVLEAEAAAKVTEWDVKVEKLLQTQTFMQSNIDRINSEIARFEAELAEILNALESNAQDVAEKEQNIQQIRETITASYDVQNETTIRLNESIARKDELMNKQKNFFTRSQELAEVKASLDKEVYRLGMQKEKLEGGLESFINYMWDEYEITLTNAAALRDPEMTDLPAMKKAISELKEQIKKLGNVNVNAIEDYKNLMERFTFMKNQHDDLIEAEATLEGIIQELDSAMRKQFTEKFAEISREFDKVFKELFGGGKGTLELMEDEDILEAGIRIIAQPPGKKLQNMMQLSGGEKALSAISLLFAIQNLKPSPFCLLDEIEAALDDSNVGRFAKYLHKLTRSTQFIVITHRRGTMEEVDRLYGITMQEKGVSTLVSVNLIDKDLTD